MSKFSHDIEQFLSDDLSALNELIRSVQGLSPVSMVPELALNGDESSEHFEFSEN